MQRRHMRCQTSLVHAQVVFDGLANKDVVSWNAMLRAFNEYGQPEGALKLYDEMGQGGTALQLYEQMLRRNVSPDIWTFVSIFKSCSLLAEKEDTVVVHGRPAKLAALGLGKTFHANAWMKGCHRDIFVGNNLISMYGRCGSVDDAQAVFRGLLQRNEISWTVLIGVYLEHGLARNALKVYEQMLEDGLSPDCFTFVSVLQACGMIAEQEESVLVNGQGTKVELLQKGKVLYSEAWLKGRDVNAFVSNTLISMYGKCGSLMDAQSIFEGLSHYDTVSWNAMLAAYIQQGQSGEVLLLYERIREFLSPDVETFVAAIQACGILAETEVDTIMDGHAIKVHYLDKGKAIHADARKRGRDVDIFVGNALIDLYGKCGSRMDVELMFHNMASRDFISWTTIIKGAVQQGRAEQALHLYGQMLEEGLSSDALTFVCVAQACSMLAENEKVTCICGHQMKANSLKSGRTLHSRIVRGGYESNVFVASTLISMYGKCKSTADAENVFIRLGRSSMVAWTAMISVYAQSGQEEKALQLYEQAHHEGCSPDVCTSVAALQACSMLAEKEGAADTWDRWKSLHTAKVMHADAWRRGFVSEEFVASSLISLYGNSGNLVDACGVFIGLPYQDVVQWTAILTAHAKQGHTEKAFVLYEQMLKDGVSPDSQIFVSVLLACGMVAEKQEDAILDGQITKADALQKCKAMHAAAQLMSCTGTATSDISVGSTLVSIYGKCGSILDAQYVFNGLSPRDVVAWTGLISAYARQCEGEQVIQLYVQMQEEGVSPDEITLLCVLQACSRTGRYDVCMRIHHTIVTTGTNLSTRLANALIHAYGKCGSMVEAENVLRTLAQPDVVSWNSLITGYARQGNCSSSIERYGEMQVAGVKPDGITFLSLLGACNHGGLVEAGVEFFTSMSRDYGIAPQIEHFASMVDLFGRAGYLPLVEAMLVNMPMEPDLAVWLCVLGACRKHGNVVLGKRAFECIVQLQPRYTAAYVLMSSIYSNAGLWNQAVEVNVSELEAAAWKKPFGKSWIQHGQEVYTFVVADWEHHQQEQIYNILQQVSVRLARDGVHSIKLNKNRALEPEDLHAYVL